MADMNPQPPEVAPEAPSATQPSFLSTSTGKVVVGVVAACILVGLVAIVAAVVIGARAQAPSVKTVSVVSVVPVGTSSSNPTTDAATVTEPGQRPLSSSFTFRNIFAPTVYPPRPATTVGSTTESVTVPANTLYLQSVQTLNGEKTATLIWNGTTYNAVAGDNLGDTPWKVVEVNSDSVLMLYGDTQVTLTTGEILSK